MSTTAGTLASIPFMIDNDPFFDKSWRPSEIEPHDPGSNGHRAQNGR